MATHYRDLFELMDKDQEAFHYYCKLPEYIREQIASRATGVNSFASLRDYAENLLRGDL